MRKIRPEVRELVHHDLALRGSDEAQGLPAREHIVRKACSEESCLPGLSAKREPIGRRWQIEVLQSCPLHTDA